MGQEEVTQVVDAHVHLKAVCCLGVGTHHHSCIVDQNVEVLLFCREVLSKGPDRLGVGQVQFPHQHLLVPCAALDFSGHQFPLLHIPASYVHAGSSLSQLLGCLLADACVSSGDHHHLPGKLDS